MVGASLTIAIKAHCSLLFNVHHNQVDFQMGHKKFSQSTMSFATKICLNSMKFDLHIFI